MDVTYVLPLRATHPPSPDLVEHLAAIAAVAQVVVADSSPDEVFAANARAWGSFATHVRPDPRHRCANGKVHNAHGARPRADRGRGHRRRRRALHARAPSRSRRRARRGRRGRAAERVRRCRRVTRAVACGADGAYPAGTGCRAATSRAPSPCAPRRCAAPGATTATCCSRTSN
ncbi:MAG: hypothetical protein R2713_00875 [Ilumatobacteraceae bacterium]